MGSLDAGGQLVDALTVVEVVDHLGGQVDILRFGLRLLPECVEEPEEFRVQLL